MEHGDSHTGQTDFPVCQVLDKQLRIIKGKLLLSRLSQLVMSQREAGMH